MSRAIDQEMAPADRLDELDEIATTFACICGAIDVPCAKHAAEWAAAALRNPVQPDARKAFVEAGWRYSHAIADSGVCSDGSCHRCRVAVAVTEAERLLGTPAAPSEQP